MIVQCHICSTKSANPTYQTHPTEISFRLLHEFLLLLLLPIDKFQQSKHISQVTK